MQAAFSTLESLFTRVPIVRNAQNIATVLLLVFGSRYLVKNRKQVLGALMRGAISSIPGAKNAVSSEIEKEVNKTVSMLFPKGEEGELQRLPEKGLGIEAVLEKAKALYAQDIDPSR